MERTAYDLGDIAVLSVLFKVAGVATDPTTVSATVRAPDGTTTVHPQSDLVHDGVGAFHLDVTADQAGDWTYKFVGTGAAADVSTGLFSVIPDPTIQNGRDLCTLADVVDRVPGYDVGDDRLTDALLGDFIAIESRDFLEETRREITPISPGSSTRVFDVDWIVCEERELLIGDAADTTAVVLKGQDGTVLQTLDSSGWVELPRVREDWEPVTSIFFPPLVNDPAFFAWPACRRREPAPPLRGHRDLGLPRDPADRATRRRDARADALPQRHRGDRHRALRRREPRRAQPRRQPQGRTRRARPLPHPVDRVWLDPVVSNILTDWREQLVAYLAEAVPAGQCRIRCAAAGAQPRQGPDRRLLARHGRSRQRQLREPDDDRPLLGQGPEDAPEA
jgi:hypothetical protein